MDRESARAEIRGRLTEYVESITEKSKGAGRRQYICPLCGSGTGTKHTGAFTIDRDGIRWKCHACGKSGDIFDLIGELEHTADYNRQLASAAATLRVTINSNGAAQGFRTDYSKAAHEMAKNSRQRKDEALDWDSEIGRNAEPEQPDYSAFIESCSGNIERTGYHRGISLDTLKRYKVGYCESWRHPSAPATAPTTPRLIIPTSRYSYIARDTRDQIPAEQANYAKMKAGKLHILNIGALQTATKPIYIVEGEIDALSIIDAGGVAVGLGTTTMIGRLLSLLAKDLPAQPLIIALDNDNAGERAAAELINGTTNPDGSQRQKGLKALDIPFLRYNVAGVYKDANEALQSDREAFTVAVHEGEQLVIDSMTREEQEEKEKYLNTSAAAHIQSFLDGITDSVNTPYIPTGFDELDTIFDGGLYEGLYIVGAISSLGKTTLIAQIADQIAQSGTDVLIFSLEMARTEIMSKSISRHTVQSILATGGDMRNAKTARGITTGKKYENYSKAEMELIKTAVEEYGAYADHIYISEGIGDIGVADIRNAVHKHITYTGNTPVVVIDYLQILAPADVRATDKQNTDKAVMELKRISRDFKLPILGISSFNRENYSNAVTMAAFKESGAIEYSSDVLIGLQLKGAGKKDFDATAEKKKNPREVELIILKNRNGRTGDKVDFKYYPMFNYFKEVAADRE